LSYELKRTPWYLGRRLGFNEKEITKILFNYQTDQEQKFQILLRWRSHVGMKSTIQKLVIFLELAGYEYDEYKTIITSEDDDAVSIYDKAPDLTRKKEKRRYEDYVASDLAINSKGKVSFS